MDVDILAGTRLAWLTGSEAKKQNLADEAIMVDSPAPGTPPSTPAAAAAPATAPAPKSPPARASRAAAPAKDNGSTTLKAVWILGGIMTLAAPMLYRNAKVNSYQNDSWNQVAQGYNNYQVQQEQNWYANGQEGNFQQGRQFFDVNDCTWWKFHCEPFYVDERGQYVSQYEMQQEYYRQQQEQQQQQYEYQKQMYDQQQEYQQQQQEYQQQQQEYQQQMYNQQQQQYQQGGQYAGQYGQGGQYGNQSFEMKVKDSSPGLKFVFYTQIILFVGMLAYGWHIITKNKPAKLLGHFLGIWLVISILAMILLKVISIESDVPVVRMTGYYGQFSVLLFLMNLSYAVFGFVAVLFFKNFYVALPPAPAQLTPAGSATGDEYVKVV